MIFSGVQAQQRHPQIRRRIFSSCRRNKQKRCDYARRTGVRCRAAEHTVDTCPVWRFCDPHVSTEKKHNNTHIRSIIHTSRRRHSVHGTLTHLRWKRTGRLQFIERHRPSCGGVVFTTIFNLLTLILTVTFSVCLSVCLSLSVCVCVCVCLCAR